MKRPNMSAYFRAQIDRHVNGMRSSQVARMPPGVTRVSGDVRSSEITVTMADGSEHKWTGGRYSSRKVSGCYAPLMPQPVK